MPDSDPIPAPESAIADGTMAFSIEGRVLRELGERLVKHPEVAVVELIKNAYDADATTCTIRYERQNAIVVQDNGHGMTLDRFSQGWMRIGTSAKEATTLSEQYGRPVTGEKGIGRFAVRFLGRHLLLDSIADDPSRGLRTHLRATFDWPEFDRQEDLGEVTVPYRLYRASPGASTGTTLHMTNLRPEAEGLNFNTICTGAIGILTPLQSLFHEPPPTPTLDEDDDTDPGFSLRVPTEERSDDDVASQILSAFVLRATVQLTDNQLDLRVYRRGIDEPYLRIVDTYDNSISPLHADIRFFPKRKGTFTNMPVDGRRARSWVSDNHGVAVYDRGFRVAPYGYPADDWLELQADVARRQRNPRSAIAKKHFPMERAVRLAESQNWMLRLPQSAQLVGLVEVQGRRVQHLTVDLDEGLVASADREGFVQNGAFRQMHDVVRGAIEALAFVDRQLQARQEQAEHDQLVDNIKAETQEAIAEIRANPSIAATDKRRIVDVLLRTETLATQHDQGTKAREQQLLIMSLLGIVAGFMTHEFGAALQEVEDAKEQLVDLANPAFEPRVAALSRHSERMREFVAYSTGFIRGSRRTPEQPYNVLPRLNHVMRTFQEYATRRSIQVDIVAARGLPAPLVPASLYDGIALNLYTNALKGVTAKVGAQSERISFRAWNEAEWHYLEVSDTGIGIPSAMYERVFDPLFTTTAEGTDPLGSGMGLGLTFVRRSVEAFSGTAEVLAPPPGFSTTVRVRLPLHPRTETSAQ